MYNGNHLTVLLTRLAPHTDTHTQKQMEPAGLYWTLQLRRIGKLGVRVWSGTWPPRAVLPTHTCGARSPWTGIPSSSAPTQPTTVGLEPMNQNPTSAARILRTTRPATNDDRRTGEPSRPEARNDLQGTKEQHPRIQLAILLIPPPRTGEG